MNILTDAAYWILRETLWSSFHKRYDVQVIGREHLEHLEEWKQAEGIASKGAILASNHRSFLDHFTIVAGLGEKSIIHFFARDFRKIKKGIMSTIYNTLYQSTGQIIIPEKQFKRGNYNKIEKALSKDRYVVMYPEGRTYSEGLGEFNKGTAQIAYSLDAALVPIRLEGVSEVWPRGGKLKYSGSMRIKVGRPINPRDHRYNDGIAGEDTTIHKRGKIARTLTEILRKEIERLGEVS